MKYKTFVLFRNVVAFGLGTCAAVGAFLGCQNATRSSQSTPVTHSDNNASRDRPRENFPKPIRTDTPAKTTAAPRAGAPGTFADRDTEIISLQKEPISRGKPAGDSARWVSVGDGFKAEFRADSGSKVWNRVKVDLDSDKKWDEKWDFKADGSIKRRVSPSDDDNYTVEYRLSTGDTKWTRVK